MSDDGTRELILDRGARSVGLRLIDNPGRTVSCGLNKAIAAAKGDIIVRMDVHTRYAADYIAQCVSVLEETGADNVGGPWRAEGFGYLQSAIAIAFNSAFAVGGARSHRLDYEGRVDSVYLGCWHRDYLVAAGMFDEELIRNQDDELNLRLTRKGARIWQSPRIRSLYFPRPNLSKLTKQYMQYGYWKVRVIQKHHLPASIRHVVPAAFLGALALSSLASLFISSANIVTFLIGAAYLSASGAASIAVCASRERLKFLAVMPLVFACYHFGYGIGFLSGIWRFAIRRAQGHGSFERLTR